jgi:hypothetical protein
LQAAAVEDSLKGVEESKTNRRLLVLESSLDERDFLNDVEVIGRKVSNPQKVLETLFSLALGEQPTRRFLEPDRTKGKHTSRDQLDGKWDDPLLMVAWKRLGDAIIYPESDQPTYLPAQLVDTDETTSDGRGCDLRDVDGDDHRGTAHTDTSENSASIDGSEVTVGSFEHDTGANHKDNDVDPKRFLATEIVGADVCTEGSEECSSLVDRDNVLLDECDIVLGQFTPTKLAGERGKCKSGSNKGRVVSNHARSEGSDSSTRIDAPVVDLLGRRPVFNESEKTHDETLQSDGSN